MVTLGDLQTRIAEELDITHLQAEEQEQVVNELGKMLYQRMLLSIFEKIPAEEHQKLKELIKADLEDEITALVQKHIPNVGEVMQAELDASMKDYREALAQSVS